MTTVKPFLRKVAREVDFSTVAKAMRFDDAWCELPAPLVQYLQVLRAAGRPYVCIRNKRGRGWAKTEAVAGLPFFETSSGGSNGWYVLLGEEVNSISFMSKGSESRISAAKLGPGKWELTLDVPMYDNGNHYRGTYWKVFHRALGI